MAVIVDGELNPEIFTTSFPALHCDNTGLLRVIVHGVGVGTGTGVGVGAGVGDGVGCGVGVGVAVGVGLGEGNGLGVAEGVGDGGGWFTFAEQPGTSPSVPL